METGNVTSTFAKSQMSAQRSVRYITWSDFSGFLRHLRLRQGLTQKRFAELLACDRTYIWRLEHGANRPSRMLLRSLRNTFGLTAQENGLLDAFAQLRAYHCDNIEVANVYEGQP